MRRLQKASLSTPAHKQTVFVFECVPASSKIPAQCSNAHRTADRVTSEIIAIASTGCQASHANVFHNLGGLDMRGLMNASLCAPKSCLKTRDLCHTFVEGSSHHSIMNLAGLGMRRLKQASLSTPKSCLKTHKQTVTAFECAFRSSKVPAQCSNAHRTADRVTSGSIRHSKCGSCGLAARTVLAGWLAG